MTNIAFRTESDSHDLALHKIRARTPDHKDADHGKRDDKKDKAETIIS